MSWMCDDCRRVKFDNEKQYICNGCLNPVCEKCIGEYGMCSQCIDESQFEEDD